MAARSVRRSFASPFVVTLAATLPAACYVQPGPPARSGGSAPQVASDETAPNHTNPPRPTGEQAPITATPDHSTTTAGVEQAPAATTVIANPPRPAPVAKQDRRWTVTKASGTCSASANSSCPKPVAGQPAPTCNPPPPMKYACPAQMTENMITVVQLAGQSDCQIEYPPIKCPPNAICNPPPPQKVACPQ